jgi:hypothetical protein
VLSVVTEDIGGVGKLDQRCAVREAVEDDATPGSEAGRIAAFQRLADQRLEASYRLADRIMVNVCRDRLREASRRRTTDLVDSSLSTPDATTDVLRRLLLEQTLFQFTLAGERTWAITTVITGGPKLGAEDGAPGGTRTHDLLLRRQTLYPLSYGRFDGRSS